MESGELELARDPSTSVALLRRLARDERASIQAAVAGNPNSPPEVLGALAAAFPGEVLRNPCFELLSLEDLRWLERFPSAAVVELMSHPEAPEWFIEQVLAGLPTFVSLLARRSRRPDVLWRLVQKHASRPRVLLDVIDNEHASASLLEHLAVERGLLSEVLQQQRHPTYFVEAALEDRRAEGAPRKVRGRDLVLWHAGAPAHELERLAASPRAFTRSLVARAPAAPEALLVRLARDPNAHVREQVSRNARCPQPLAEKLRRELPLRPQPLPDPSDQ